MALPPLRPALQQFPHPEQRLDVVDQRRHAPKPELIRKRRLLPRQPPLALDALQHRALLAADISPRAPPQMQPRPTRRQLRHLAPEHLDRHRVLVPDIKIDILGLDHRRPDQRPLQEPMRIGVQVVPVLERPRLPLVAIDRHHPRTLLRPDRPPLPPGRKPGAPQPPQPAIIQRLQHRLDRQFPRPQPLQQRIPPARAICLIIDVVVRNMRMAYPPP